MTPGHHADPAAAMMTANPTNARNSRPACRSEHPPVSRYGQGVWLAGSAPNLKLWEEEREGREAVRHRRVFV
jgi:hypothetical protein